MTSFIKRLFCRHKLVFHPMPSPFYGFPIYDSNGFWIKDVYAHKCTKCNKIIWKDDYKETK